MKFTHPLSKVKPIKAMYLIFFVYSSLPAQVKYKALIQYEFVSIENKTLPGNSTDIGSEWGCNQGILEDDKIGNLAIASELYQNGCYTDGKYNHKNFPVTYGSVQSQDGTLKLEAYKLSPATSKASEFLASQHMVHIKFPSAENYNIYSLTNGAIDKITTISPGEINPGEYTKISSLSASKITSELTIFIAPSNQSISTYSSISSTVEAANVFSSKEVQVNKIRFSIDGQIFDTKSGYASGPSSHGNIYGYGRQFFYFGNQDKLEVIWQDKDDASINLSNINLNNSEHTSTKLPGSSGNLAGVTRGEQALYYLLIDTEGSKAKAILYKTDLNGNLLKSNALDVSKSGLNIWKFRASDKASLLYRNNKLGMIISRQMNKHTDGLNHQGAIAVTFDPSSLEVIRNFGQTSGHSFDNILYAGEGEDFLGIDLGDNYPRGIHLHKIGEYKRSKVVYTFKTSHGTDPRSPAGANYPLYSEISKQGKKFYKWSNDNSTYSEIGGVIDEGDGYGIYFIGEPDPSGRAINNARAQGYLFDARDIGYVKVRKDFISSEDFVLSKGINESSGFYTFGGRWSEQSNQGINWIVDYKDKKLENASRLKAIKFQDNTILFWEKWTDKQYITTYMMKLGTNGRSLGDAIAIGNHLRLNRRDEPLVTGKRIIFINGNKLEKKLEVIEVLLQ